MACASSCFSMAQVVNVCIVGYVMDTFCINRGTLLDNPSVKTLRNPELHTIHCLVDVSRCRNSGYEVLRDPEGQRDDILPSIQARCRRKQRRYICSPCRRKGRLHNVLRVPPDAQKVGYRATVKGKVDLNTTAPLLMTNVQILPADDGCGQEGPTPVDTCLGRIVQAEIQALSKPTEASC